MKKVIYKYSIEDKIYDLPYGKILDVEYQVDGFYIWILHDQVPKGTMKYEFKIVGTGWEVEGEEIDRFHHMKTIHNSGFVWHVFYRHYYGVNS